MRPQETSRSPPRVPTEDKSAARWRDDERRADKKDNRSRHEETESRARGTERRVDHAPETSAVAAASEARRGKDQRDAATPPLPSAGPEARDSSSVVHEEVKKKTKSQKKNLKKNRKEEEVTVVVPGDRFNPEPPPPSSSSAPSEAPRPLMSPRKTGKKKALDRKRKRSRGAESDVSEDEQATQHPVSKRRRGPRTPPPINKEDLPSQRALMAARSAAVPPLKMDTNFSDWSDEDVPERADASSASLPGKGLDSNCGLSRCVWSVRK